MIRQKIMQVCLSLFLFSLILNAQEKQEIKMVKKDHSNTGWYQELMSSNPNYWKIKKGYELYFSLNKNEKSKEEKITRRWLQINGSNIDKEGYLLPELELSELKQIFNNQKIVNKPKKTTSLHDEYLGSWRMIGPFHGEKTRCGTSPVMSGGYTDRVYINPYNTSNMYAGTSYGGLWVSQDAGNTWVLSDAEFPNGTNTYANRDYYYGDIEASAQNPQIVYAATEAGLLKSSNGGISWSYCNELNRTVLPNVRPYFIAVSKENPLVLLSSFGRKIYRSIDGGNSWTMVFDNSQGGDDKKFANTHSSQPLGMRDRTYNFWGLDFHPTNINVVYLGTWNSDNEPCVYKSIDKGVTFNFLTNIIEVTGRTDTYGLQGLEMITVPSAANKVIVRPYFSLDTIYHVSESGKIDKRIKPGARLEGFAVDWNNANIVYSGYYGGGWDGSKVMKSTDEGLTFTAMTDGFGGCPKYVHPDIRGYSVVGDTVLVAHDGGLSRSFDGMNTIETIGNNISAVDLWGFSSSFKTDITLAGCDHGPTKIRRFDGNGGWTQLGGGDANACTINPANDSLFYYNHGYGTFVGKLNSDNSISTKSIINNDVSLDKLEVHPNIYTTIYGVKGNLVKVSKENINNATVFKDFGKPVTRFRIARKDANIMYVLLQNSIVQKSEDGGLTWRTITPSFLASKGQTSIIDIEVGATPNELWLLYGGNQNECKVLKSTDGGSTWENITENLSVNSTSQFVYQRGTDGGLYVYLNGGGVWYKNSKMQYWQKLGSGLPMIGYSRNLYTVPAKNKFRMGSSRGAWEHDLIETSKLDAQISMNNNTVDRWNTQIRFRDFSAYYGNDITFEWSFPGGTPSTSNSEYPTVTYTKSGKYSVTLTIRDGNGNSSTQTLEDIILVKNEGKPGMFPIADSYVRNGSSSSANFGLNNVLVVKNDGTGYYRMSYLKFDLSQYTDSIINTGYLQLFVQNANTNINVTNWELWKCNDDNWIEDNINWNNKPQTTTLVETIPAKSSGIAEWNLKDILIEELNGDKVLTLAVKSTVANLQGDVNFYSKEEGIPLLRPQILINRHIDVKLDYPTKDDVLQAGSISTLKASVVGDNIQSVKFLINNKQLGVVNEIPYNLNWNWPEQGIYSLKVVATDNLGFSSSSREVKVVVMDTIGTVINPVADSYVRNGGYSSSNFGSDEKLIVKNDVSWYNREVYLKFSLANFASKQTSKKLRLFIKDANTNILNTDWEVWTCSNSNWTESELTWNNKPSSKKMLTTLKGKKEGIVEWDISNLSKEDLDENGFVTLLIKSTTKGGSTDVIFYSKETNTQWMRPVILINEHPEIRFIQPLEAEVLIEQVSKLIKLEVTDDHKVTEVSIFIDDDEKKLFSLPPYEWMWNNIETGSYTIKVKATDDSSNISEKSINVTVADNPPPIIESFYPRNNTYWISNKNYKLLATVSDSVGGVKQVDFYKNGNWLGTDYSSPYSFDLFNIEQGEHLFDIEVTDTHGKTTVLNPPKCKVITILPNMECDSPIWNPDATYTIGVLVQFKGKIYEAVDESKGATPESNQEIWRFNSNCAVLGLSSLKDKNEDSSILLYPNPANTILYVEGYVADNKNNKISIVVYNTAYNQNMKVFEQEVDVINGSYQAKIDVSRLENGVYLLKCSTTSKSVKFLVNHTTRLK